MPQGNHAGHGGHQPRGPTGGDWLAIAGIVFMIVTVLMLAVG